MKNTKLSNLWKRCYTKDTAGYLAKWSEEDCRWDVVDWANSAIQAVELAGLPKDDCILLAQYRHTGVGSRYGWALIPKGVRRWPVKYGVVSLDGTIYRYAKAMAEDIGVSLKTANNYVKKGQTPDGRRVTRYMEAPLWWTKPERAEDDLPFA